MSRTPSDRSLLRRFALALLPAAAIGLAQAAAAQDPAPAPPDAPRIVSHEVSISRGEARLVLELADGRRADYAIADGSARIDGQTIGDAARGSALERSWRDLLNAAIDASADDLPRLLADWSAQGEVGSRLDQALESAVAGAIAPPAPVAPISDSLLKLEQRNEQLAAELARLKEERSGAEDRFDGRDRWRPGPLHYLTRGFAELIGFVVSIIVLFAIGVATIMFGGRKYIEGVADTVRHATLRSFMVGLAGAFLTLPAFVLGIIALAVSIVGIPALIAWIPGFWLAFAVAVLLGYLAVAHAAGESLAERRYSGAEWFQRSNSYYFLMTGLVLLFGLFVASAAISMLGPWLGFFSGLFKFLAVMVTIVSAAIGYGAVLISRGGTRPIRADGRPTEPDLFTDAEEGAL